MDDILAKKNRHLFLEEKDNVGNSFIANVNNIVDDLDNIDAVANDLGRIDTVADNIDNVNTVAENMDDINTTVENLDKIDQFNDNLVGLLESLLEQLGEDGNAWLVRLTELGESILATTSAFNYAVTTTLAQDIASGATLTLPDAIKYRVGTHMLMISWNGTVCYRGDQYNEVGNFNQWSTTIIMNVPLKAGDKIQFRVVALADSTAFVGQIDSVIGNTSVIATGSTENRTLANRFADIVNVKDYGAVCDGVTNDATAFLAAANVGCIFVPFGETYVSLSQNSGLNALSNALDGAILVGNLKINIPAGHYEQTLPWTFAMSGGEKLSIEGAEPVAVTISSASVSGSSGAWTVVFTVSSTSGISVGDYALLTEDGCTAGTGAHEMLRGVWKITAVDSETISVLNTAYCSSFPTFTLTSGKAKILTTVVQFKDCDGVVVKQGCVGNIDNIVIVGNASEYWDSSDIAGTEKGTHGVHVGNATMAQEEGNPLGLSNGSIHLGTSFGVSDFDQQGIVCSSGGAIFARWTASCSNRRRGYYAETCGSIQCKNSVGSGNYLDGYIGDFGGSIICNLSSACGNNGNGFNSINGGDIGVSNSVAKGNVGNGYICTGSGEIACGNSEAAGNGIDGYHCENGGVMLANNATASSNANDGFEATGNGVIRTFSATASNNVRYGFRASSGGTIINNSAFSGTGNGALTSCEWGYLNDSTSRASTSISADFTVSKKLVNSGNDFRVQRDTEYLGLSLSGIYDVNFTRGTHSWIIKNGGDIIPGDGDGIQSIGAKNHRLAYVYSVNLGSASLPIDNIYENTSAQSESDLRIKDNVLDIDLAIFEAWKEVRLKVFQFKKAIAKKGENYARFHFGLIAQDVNKAFASRGLDASRYGLFCYDKWDDQYEDVEIVDSEAEYDDNGNEIKPAVVHVEHVLVKPAGDKYSIRYEEALILECAYQRWLGEQRDAKIEALMQRISALENNQ